MITTMAAKAQCSSSVCYIESFKTTGQVVSILLLLKLFWRWGNWVPEKSNTLSLVENENSHPVALTVEPRPPVNLLITLQFILRSAKCFNVPQLSSLIVRISAEVFIWLFLIFTYLYPHLYLVHSRVSECMTDTQPSSKGTLFTGHLYSV